MLCNSYTLTMKTLECECESKILPVYFVYNDLQDMSNKEKACYSLAGLTLLLQTSFKLI